MAAALVEEELQLELPPEPNSVTAARHAIARFARQVRADVDAVSLAVSEAVGNAVVHAFRGRDAGTITVSARVARGMLLVTVADDGIGMRPNPTSPGLGFGLALMGKLTEDLRVASRGGGTVVSMGFPVETAGSAG